ncbi:MAG: hypothetical protein PHC53_03190 [Patescibacteria group bacterium]|nr:hypothetical protein [Patescibacteria group bacterium]
MRQLPPELIASFKKVILEVYVRQLTDDEAQEYGSNLLETMALVLKVRARTLSKNKKGDSAPESSNPE